MEEFNEFLKMLREEEEKLKNATPAFSLFSKNLDKKRLPSGGIDGFMSMPITKSALLKFIEKKMGKDPAKALKLVTTGNPFYASLREKADNNGTFVTRKVRKGNTTQQTNFYQIDIGSEGMTVIVTEFDRELMLLTQKNKKKFDHYVKVSFQGLNQPTYWSRTESNDCYTAFLRKFPISIMDFAVDVKCKRSMLDTANDLAKAVEKHYHTKGIYPRVPKKAGSVTKAVYFNFERTAENKDAKSPQFESLLMYDKWDKQTYYHRQNLQRYSQPWHRIEVRFKVGGKFNKKYDIIRNHLERFCNFLRDPRVMPREVNVSLNEFTLYSNQYKAVMNKKPHRFIAMPNFDITTGYTGTAVVDELVEYKSREPEPDVVEFEHLVY